MIPSERASQEEQNGAISASCHVCIYHQIPLDDSEPCSEALQGVIRFDPGRAQLYFCDGSEWVVSAPL